MNRPVLLISTKYRRSLLPLLAVSGSLLAAGAAAQTSNVISERDYLADMPVVLSVSRLSQPLDETPGAVTVLDHDFIARTGARDVADLLRWVPGFQVSTSFESVAPLVSYHGAFDSYSNRMELLIDGRSVYSPYFIGSIGTGLQTVALQDIERIEVLRGSNSAAYGARAMLGVINIVTRHTADTLGAQGSLAVGENGVRDVQARFGWGNQGGTFRIDADRRGDDGLHGANGKNQVDRVNLRADLIPRAGDELQLGLGGYSISSGRGFAGNIDNLLRPMGFDSGYAKIDYKHSLTVDEDISLRFSHSQESYQDQFPYALTNVNPAYGVNDIYIINAGGQASSDVLTVQHGLRRSETQRLVWGGEFRSERVKSIGLYNTDSSFVTNFTRLFGNLEWRPAQHWLLNAGGLFEHSSVTGDTLAPRAMVNWHLGSGQTLRFGVSKAFRPPSTFEESANVHFVFAKPSGYSGNFDITNVKSSGQLQPETMVAKEIGYLGEFPKWRMSLDVRLFDEQMKGFIRQQNSVLPKDYANTDDVSIRGGEYTLKWQPWSGARVMFNQSYTTIDTLSYYPTATVGTPWAAPKVASSLVYSQKLPADLELTLMQADSGTATLAGSGYKSRVAMTRTDVRLAKAVRWGASKGEVALVLQNLGQPYQDYFPAFTFERRAFVTLMLQD